MAENATNIANATTIDNSATMTTKVRGLRSAPSVASFVLDYQIPKLERLRVGLTGVMTPDYNIAIFNGIAYKSGASLPLGLAGHEIIAVSFSG